MRDNTIRQAAASDGSDTKTSLRARSLEHRPALKRAARNCAGFTLIELLEITAIIAMLIGAGLPAVQNVREKVARTQAQDNLLRLKDALRAYHGQNSQPYPKRPPNQWFWPDEELSAFCQAHPQLCSFDVDLLTGRKNGYSYFLFAPNRSASQSQEGFAAQDRGEPAFQIMAEPMVPGVTASDTLVIDQNGAITRFPTPGAGEGRQRMFEGIRAAGAETIAELLNRDRSASPVIRDFVESPEALNSAFDKLDSDDNGLASFDEILNLDTGPEISIAEFLNSVNREMRLDLLSPEMKRTIGVRLSELRGNPAEIFSFDGLCSLTRLYISAEELANQLCAGLMAAKAAAESGDAEAKARFLMAYIKEVEAQANTTLTRRKATTLITLAQTL